MGVLLYTKRTMKCKYSTVISRHTFACTHGLHLNLVLLSSGALSGEPREYVCRCTSVNGSEDVVGVLL